MLILSFHHFLINSFNNYLLRTYYVLDTSLKAGCPSMNKKEDTGPLGLTLY